MLMPPLFLLHTVRNIFVHYQLIIASYILFTQLYHNKKGR